MNRSTCLWGCPPSASLFRGGSQEWAEPSASPPKGGALSSLGIGSPEAKPWGYDPVSPQFPPPRALEPQALPFLGFEGRSSPEPQPGPQCSPHQDWVPSSLPVRGAFVVGTPHSVPRCSCWWGRGGAAGPPHLAALSGSSFLGATQASRAAPGSPRGPWRSVCVWGGCPHLIRLPVPEEVD